MLANCLRDLAIQASKDKSTHTAAQFRLVGRNIELQLRCTRQVQEMKNMSSRLERYKRDKDRMRNMLAYLLDKNQQQEERISELEMQGKQNIVTAEDLACASALLQLRNL